jgi:hypothetical protein
MFLLTYGWREVRHRNRAATAHLVQRAQTHSSVSRDGDEMAIIERRAHTAGGGSRLERTAFRGLVLVAVVGLSLLPAACGGGGSSSAKLTQVGATSSANSSSSSSASAPGNPAAYSACMRSHGFPRFPDPDSAGNVNEVPKGIDPSSSRFVSAHRACRALLPRSTPAAQPDPHELQALLRFARCMRARGVHAFPDPSPDGGTVQSMPPSVDTHSPQFVLAQRTCQRLVPGLFGGG